MYLPAGLIVEANIPREQIEGLIRDPATKRNQTRIEKFSSSAQSKLGQ